jgi:hypothetical protein
VELIDSFLSVLDMSFQTEWDPEDIDDFADSIFQFKSNFRLCFSPEIFSFAWPNFDTRKDPSFYLKFNRI